MRTQLFERKIISWGEIVGSFNFFNNRGMSLVEVLVSLGITVILMSATASMFVTQQRENRALNQKLEMVDLKNQIMQAFQNSSTCTWQIQGKTFNTSGVTSTNPSSTSIDLVELRHGPNSSSLLLAKTNSTLPGSQSNLKVASIRFNNILATGNPDEYKGHFEITFMDSSLSRPMRPTIIPQVIQATGSPTATITACGAGLISLDDMVIVEGPVKNRHYSPSIAMCPPGYGVISGGSRYLGTSGCNDEWTGLSEPTADKRGWRGWMECARHKTVALCMKLRN